MKKYAYLWKNLLALAIACCFAIPAAADFLKMHGKEAIYESERLTEVRMLSDYCETLRGEGGDAEVYVFDSGVPGGTMLILGGTHPNESAGLLAAVAIIENISVTKGRVIVIPRTNESGFSHTAPLDGTQDFLSFTLADGSVRTFRVGSRLVNPVDQWPDRSYYLGSSGRELKGSETTEIRNVNRMYPGDPDGVMTEKVCFAIKTLIDRENVAVCMDMHEGNPEFGYLDTTMAHERALNVVSLMAMDMNLSGLTMATELSGVTSYGLSHRSLGDNTNALMALMETCNPSMGYLHTAMNDGLIVRGVDSHYARAHGDGYVAYDVPEEGIPLIERAARHMVCIDLLKNAYNFYYPDDAIEFSGFSDYNELVALGFENLLKPV